MASKQVIPPEVYDIHNKMVDYLGTHIKKNQFIRLKERFRENPLTAVDIATIKDIYGLMECLRHNKTVHVGDYEALVSKLEDINARLACYVTNKEREINEIINGGRSSTKKRRTDQGQRHSSGRSSTKKRRTDQGQRHSSGRSSTKKRRTDQGQRHSSGRSSNKKRKADQGQRHSSEIHANLIPMIEIHADLKPMIERAKHMIFKEKEEKKFCVTKAFRDAQDKLQKNRIVVIKGNTGDGKTATAIQLLHWLSEEQQGRNPLQLHKIKTLDRLAPKSQLITFIDDIFGEKDIGKNDVQEWNKRITDVKTLFVDEQTHANFLLITIRNEIFNALEKRSLGTVFTKDNIIDLSLDSYKIAEEKRELLDLYKPKDFLWKDEEKETILTLTPNIGFPQCCQLFCNSVQLQEKRVKFFEEPFQFLNLAMSKLRECSAILFLFLNEGIIRVKDLDQNSAKVNETVYKNMLEQAFTIKLIDDENKSTTLTDKQKIGFVKEGLDKLLGFLVVKEKHWSFDDDVYRFYHDSIYVAVALLYGEKTLIGYIQNCPRKFLSYITTSKTSTDMIVISSDYYTDMCERLLREFVSKENGYDTTVASLDVWKDRVFVESFVRLLNDRKVDKCAVLNKACESGSEECALYLLSVGVKPDKDTPFCVVRGGCVNVLREILQCDVTARYSNNHNVLHKACMYGREEMVTVLCDAYPHLVHDTWFGQTPLHSAAWSGNCCMFETVERTVHKSLCRVEDEQHKCETVDGRVVHVSCACAQYMSQLVNVWGWTVLHVSCMYGDREKCKFVCERYPALTSIVDKFGRHCLHHIAERMSDVDLFTECETHVKHYLESTGREYDITAIRDSGGRSVLDWAKERTERMAKERGTENNPLYDHLVKVFGSK